MPQAYHYPKRTHQSTAFASSTLQTLKPSLVYAGLLAGAVGGAPESIQAPALDDHHTPVDNKAGGAVASIKSWLTLPKARRLSDVQRHQGLGLNKHQLQPGVNRARTEDFSNPAIGAPGRNAFGDADKYQYDVQVYTVQHTRIRLPALLDTGCDPNLIREDIVREAGLPIDIYPGPPLSQADGTCYLPPGQVTTRIHFCGGTRTFNVDFLLAPSSVEYDILIGGDMISRAQLLVRNPAGFLLGFAKETQEQVIERQRRQQEAQRLNDRIERQRAEERRRQREREMAEEQCRQRERDRR